MIFWAQLQKLEQKRATQNVELTLPFGWISIPTMQINGPKNTKLIGTAPDFGSQTQQAHGPEIG